MNLRMKNFAVEFQHTFLRRNKALNKETFLWKNCGFAFYLGVLWPTAQYLQILVF